MQFTTTAVGAIGHGRTNKFLLNIVLDPNIHLMQEPLGKNSTQCSCRRWISMPRAVAQRCRRDESGFFGPTIISHHSFCLLIQYF